MKMLRKLLLRMTRGKCENHGRWPVAVWRGLYAMCPECVANRRETNERIARENPEFYAKKLAESPDVVENDGITYEV